MSLEKLCASLSVTCYLLGQLDAYDVKGLAFGPKCAFENGILHIMMPKEEERDNRTVFDID